MSTEKPTQGGDLLAWLENAITRREELAQAAPKGPWRAIRSYRGPDSPPGYEDYKIQGVSREVAGPGHEGGGVFGEAAAQHIAANDPASVLRRCAADRKLLRLHRKDGWQCAVCADPEAPAEDSEGEFEWSRTGTAFPCPTVLAIAEGYGWTEGEQ